jgi:hypothetical protein
MALSVNFLVGLPLDGTAVSPARWRSISPSQAFRQGWYPRPPAASLEALVPGEGRQRRSAVNDHWLATVWSAPRQVPRCQLSAGSWRENGAPSGLEMRKRRRHRGRAGLQRRLQRLRPGRRRCAVRLHRPARSAGPACHDQRRPLVLAFHREVWLTGASTVKGAPELGR